MAVVGMCGFNSQKSNGPEGETLVNTASYSTAIKRTGIASARCNPVSGASGYVNLANVSPIGAYIHWAMYIASLPSVARIIAGTIGVGNCNILLNADETLSPRIDTTAIGTTTLALSPGQWYWIGYKNIASATGVLLQVRTDSG